jgi:hypothetical protein
MTGADHDYVELLSKLHSQVRADWVPAPLGDALSF